MNKYCPNCVHYKTTIVEAPYPYERIGEFCGHPEALYLTGKLRSLEDMRYADDAPCGREGTLYEERPPAPKPAIAPQGELPKTTGWRRMFT